jgi:hypothetical protein
LTRFHRGTTVVALFNLSDSPGPGHLPERGCWEELLVAPGLGVETAVDLGPWQFRVFRSQSSNDEVQ